MLQQQYSFQYILDFITLIPIAQETKVAISMISSFDHNLHQHLQRFC